MQANWSDDEYIGYEHRIYEAAVVPELWPEVLATLGTVSNSAGGVLLCFNERGTHTTQAPALDRVTRRFVEEGWGKRNPRAGGVIAKGLVGAPRFVTEVDYFDEGQADRDPMTRELFRTEGLGWAAGFLLQLPHDDLIVMSVEQYQERGPIQGRDLERLNSLYPHLARGAMLAGRANLERVRVAIDTLTAIGIPAAAISPNRRVILANAGFDAATHVWTTRGGDRLGLHDRTADGLLTQSLEQLSSAYGPRSIPIRQEVGGAVTGVVQIIPIRRAAHDVFGSSAAIVVLNEPKQAMADATLIHSLFDLTPAELVVAQAIGSGLSVAAIARQNHRSVATIRNQLASVMSKTGCTRQAELALLMRQLAVSPKLYGER